MDSTKIKSVVCDEIEKNKDKLIGVAKEILENPEPGFKEFKTAKIVSREFSDLGMEHESGIAITGLKSQLDTGKSGQNIAVIGELDSLKVLGHPFEDKETTAAHACGHHCQIAMMLGVAVGLKASGVLESLEGKVTFMAVPAEEYIEVEYRDNLRRSGEIEFLGGKPEFVRLGHFDDVDMAMMTHTSVPSNESKISFGGTNNGLVAKSIQFSGVASHAGGAPHMGVNALNAAMVAMSAIHAQRETYRDQDTIRIHPIITKGGVAVSSVPADVRMETYVRGASIDAFLSASEKVDRALRAGAMAVGGSVTITTLPGYLPIQSNESFLDLYKSNAAKLVGEEKLQRLTHRTGSTDMGDISQLMPVIHPYVEAASGNGHGIDYVIDDYDLAVVTGAKAMAMTVIDLLADGASNASRIVSENNSPLTKSSYLSLLRSMTKEETFKE
ncbi:MAG: amidohydrolase [Chloroflexota bacterium]|nr:amidohydrolase [Chloroflexota bacterium]